MNILTTSLIGIWMLVGTVGCASSALRVESNPEGADVFVAIEGQAPKKIGTAPLNILEGTINPGQHAFQVTVSKEGYHSESVLIPAGSFSRSAVVNVRLNEIPSTAKQLNEQTLQKLASLVASAQAMIVSKEYGIAEQTLINGLSQYPNVSTLHELLGNVYYLQRDLTRALSSYRRAHSMNPNNSDTQRMIRKIEDIEGSRGAASTGGTR